MAENETADKGEWDDRKIMFEKINELKVLYKKPTFLD